METSVGGGEEEESDNGGSDAESSEGGDGGGDARVPGGPGAGAICEMCTAAACSVDYAMCAASMSCMCWYQCSRDQDDEACNMRCGDGPDNWRELTDCYLNASDDLGVCYEACGHVCRDCIDDECGSLIDDCKDSQSCSCWHECVINNSSGECMELCGKDPESWSRLSSCYAEKVITGQCSGLCSAI